MRHDRKSFIEAAIAIHGNKYDYSNVEYINSHIKVKIVCPVHGLFEQDPTSHIGIKRCGCNKCGSIASGAHKKDSAKSFIEKARQIYGDKYDYSKVEYVGSKEKVIITCREHGDFLQKPNNHLSGVGCYYCSGHHIRNIDDFIRIAKEVHNDRYDYSKSVYTGAQKKLIIICKEHGEFLQDPNNHIDNKNGCPACGIKSRSEFIVDTVESFIEKAKNVHGDKYDYSKVRYINSSNKVCIICLKHGEFWQKPNSHIYSKCGCPNCKRSKGEETIANILLEYNISFESEKKFDDCKYKRKLPFDFFIEEKNILIEYDGIQHFESIGRFGGEKSLELIQLKDEIKTKWARDNNKQLYRISYKDNIKEKLTEILGV